MSKTLSRNEVTYQQEPPTVEAWEEDRLAKEDTLSKTDPDKPLVYHEPTHAKKKKQKQIRVIVSGDEQHSVISEAEPSDSEWDHPQRHNRRREGDRQRQDGNNPSCRCSSSADKNRGYRRYQD